MTKFNSIISKLHSYVMLRLCATT